MYLIEDTSNGLGPLVSFKRPAGVENPLLDRFMEVESSSARTYGKTAGPWK